VPVQTNSRPQVIDAQGRNWTPKPLALSKAELAAAAGVAVANRTRAAGGAGTLAASSASAVSEGDLGGDTQSAGGFTQSVASDGDSATAGGARGLGDEGWSESLFILAPMLQCHTPPLPPSSTADDTENAGDGAAGGEDASTVVENTGRGAPGAFPRTPPPSCCEFRITEAGTFVHLLPFLLSWYAYCSCD
jgi:hypothetical protein